MSQDGSGQQHLGIIQQKWGDALAAGFQVVPNILIREQSRLGLDAIDVVILLNLMAHWWTEDSKPFVSATVIGKRMKVSTRTVERHLKRLEQRSLIGRDARGTRTVGGPYIRHFDLTPLVAVLKDASRNAVAKRSPRAKEGFNEFEPKGALVSETLAP